MERPEISDKGVESESLPAMQRGAKQPGQGIVRAVCAFVVPTDDSQFIISTPSFVG